MSPPGTVNDDKPEPFPSLSPVVSSNEGAGQRAQNAAVNDRPASAVDATTSSAGRTRRTRGSSLLSSIVNSAPPLGMWQAVGEGTSKIPTLPEIKNGSYSTEGWSHEGQLENRHHNPHDIHMRRLTRSTASSMRTSGSKSTRATITSAQGFDSRHLAVAEEGTSASGKQNGVEDFKPPHRTDTAPAALGMHHTTSATKPSSPVITPTNLLSSSHTAAGPDESGTYPNGYRFPRKHTWTQSFAIASAAFGKFFITPTGFLITLYGLNVVAWGAMIFFVLIPGATPAMCPYPYNKAGGISCDDKYSPRSKWIEYDSQILNALFCVTGFGLLPWRLRDFYYLYRWRICKDHNGHRKLAGIYKGWYRLPGSDQLSEDLGPPPAPEKEKKMKNRKEVEVADEALPAYTDEDLATLSANPAVPLPVWKMPEPPLTGVRSAPTKSWNLDIVIWMYILNSAFQVCLAGFMWGMTRFNRPSWATALFIVLGFLTGIAAGLVVFKEGKKVKAAEGIPVKDYDVVENVEEFQERRVREEKKQQRRDKKSNRHAEKSDGADVAQRIVTRERDVAVK